MDNIGSNIIGGEKLTSIFDHWPSFHDAEILELHFDRGDVQDPNTTYRFPELTIKFHLWKLTKDVDSTGHLVCTSHTMAVIKFSDVSGFEMRGFNHQNAILGMSIHRNERSEKPSPYFVVQLDPAFGIESSFECTRIEVIEARPCSEHGMSLTNVS